MIFIIGASIAFFLEFILIAKKNKSLSDKVLTLWMFVLGTHLLLQYFEFKGLDFTYHFLLGVMTPFPLIHGPLLYLYVLTLTTGLTKLRWFDYLHALPVVLLVLRMVPFFLLPGPEKVAFVNQLAIERNLLMNVVLLSIMLSGVLYIIFSLILLRKFRKKLASNYSYTDKINLDWLRNLILGMVVVWTIVVVGHSLDNVLNIDIGPATDFLIYLSLSAFVLVIGYFGIQQTDIFAGRIPMEITAKKAGEVVKTDSERYQKSGLKAAQAEKLLSELQNYMQQDKPYLDHKLTLTDLANALKIHPNYLSQVINDKLNMNFYDFINKARLDEFLKMVNSPKSKHLTILALALDSGYSSKSSFNKFFKRTMVKTPSQHIKSISS